LWAQTRVSVGSVDGAEAGIWRNNSITATQTNVVGWEITKQVVLKNFSLV